MVTVKMESTKLWLTVNWVTTTNRRSFVSKIHEHEIRKKKKEKNIESKSMQRSGSFTYISIDFELIRAISIINQLEM